MRVELIILSLVSCHLALEDNDIFEQWKQFQEKFQKCYRSPLETRNRFSIFEENLKKIESHNGLFKEGKVTYQLGVTKFADITSEEFLDYVNRHVYDKKEEDFGVRLEEIDSDLGLPKSLDWRDSGAVTEIKDQGDCGAGWTFSATGGLEGQAVLKKNLTINLSEQNLIDCAGEGYYSDGCNYGRPDQAFIFVLSKGIETESEYPYEGEKKECRQTKRTFTINGLGLPSTGEVNLRKSVTKEGPISVLMEATSNLQLYKSGVFYDGNCTGETLNHGVLVIGYGVEPKPKQEYWLIKNSYGTEWGESGYLRLARNKDNNCGIASKPSYPLIL